MISIQNGLPEVMQEDDGDDDDILFDINISKWTCPVCLVRNESNQAHCLTCRT